MRDDGTAGRAEALRWLQRSAAFESLLTRLRDDAVLDQLAQDLPTAPVDEEAPAPDLATWVNA